MKNFDHTASLSTDKLSALSQSENSGKSSDALIQTSIHSPVDSSYQQSELSYHRVKWKQSSQDILAIRHKVFIIERHYEENILCELDDKECIHLIAKNKEGKMIACARLNPNGRISKIAVLIAYRGEGVGSRILRELVAIGKKKKIKLVSLNAEICNKHLYDHQNFSAVGPVYMKQGIPHQMLACKLA